MFEEMTLSVEVNHRLTDPHGEYDYLRDLSNASGALGDAYNMLFAYNRFLSDVFITHIIFFPLHLALYL